MEEAKYWNNKWPKAPIIYGGRALRGADLSKRIGVDVKIFITTNDEIEQQIIRRYGLVKESFDATALAIQRWVVNFLTYKYDEETSNVPEFWQFPFETIQSSFGDCEDGGILIASLMINAGIPPWRVKVAAGNVQVAPTAPMGGHAYAIYLASDDNWRILDWCYLEDSKLDILDKPLARNGGQRNAYKDVWFTFNNEYSWNQKALSIKGRVANDRADLSSNSLEEVLDEVDELNLILEGIDKKYDNGGKPKS